MDFKEVSQKIVENEKTLFQRDLIAQGASYESASDIMQRFDIESDGKGNINYTRKSDGLPTSRKMAVIASRHAQPAYFPNDSVARIITKNGKNATDRQVAETALSQSVGFGMNVNTAIQALEAGGNDVAEAAIISVKNAMLAVDTTTIKGQQERKYLHGLLRKNIKHLKFRHLN